MTDLPKHLVTSGEYYVGGKEPKVLQAFLGSCVGVTLHDSDNGVGGLIHFLLPEPVSQKSKKESAKYASMGLPIFINTLCNAGASKESLKASVAGGAFVGPISRLDLNLNIGGRTVDVISNVLHEEGIEIEKSETGGFFTCCMNMNMQNLEVHIEPIGYYDKFSEEHKIQIPSSEEIHRAVESIKPIPQVVMKILRMVHEGIYEVGKIADDVRGDQVITARTLRFCNSVLFAKKKRIDCIDHALVFLGQELFLKSVLAGTFENFYSQYNRGYSLCKGGLYHHAVGVAAVAEKLADFTGTVQPGIAYTAGIIHDIGKVVIDQYIASAYPYFYRNLQEEKTFLQIERELFGIDHTEVGSRLAEQWSFPDSLVSTISHHHNPERCTKNQELTHIVYLADLLMSRFNTGLEIERMNTDDLVSRLQKIRLSSSKFPEIVDNIPPEALGPSPDLAMNS